ncbi:MAG: hypothetical protein AB8B61_05610 [Cyclobacteriaceae bacterium]
MAVTRIERKLRRKRAQQNAKAATIKRLNAQPVIKQVDVEAMKAEFAAKAKKPAKKAAPKKAEKAKEEAAAE